MPFHRVSPSRQYGLLGCTSTLQSCKGWSWGRLQGCKLPAKGYRLLACCGLERCNHGLLVRTMHCLNLCSIMLHISLTSYFTSALLQYCEPLVSWHTEQQVALHSCSICFCHSCLQACVEQKRIHSAGASMVSVGRSACMCGGGRRCVRYCRATARYSILDNRRRQNPSRSAGGGR